MGRPRDPITAPLCSAARRVRIYQPAPNPKQKGLRARPWVLEFEGEARDHAAAMDECSQPARTIALALRDLGAGLRLCAPARLRGRYRAPDFAAPRASLPRPKLRHRCMRRTAMERLDTSQAGP